MTAEPDRLQPIEDQLLLTHRVARSLREAILSGRIAAGSRLRVPELAAELGVSRTPAREALYVLERDGLVEVLPRRGAVVLHGSAQDLEELFAMREVLDGLAARLTAQRATESERRQVKTALADHLAALRAGDIDRYLELDLAFHALLTELSHNRRLVRARAQYSDQARLIMLTASRPGAMGKGVANDHRAIAAAVVAADADAAEDAARSHVRRVRAYTMARLFPAGRGTAASDL
jgi:DNA-binding GntR family transcriptional regulator